MKTNQSICLARLFHLACIYIMPGNLEQRPTPQDEHLIHFSFPSWFLETHCAWYCDSFYKGFPSAATSGYCSSTNPFFLLEKKPSNSINPCKCKSSLWKHMKNKDATPDFFWFLASWYMAGASRTKMFHGQVADENQWVGTLCISKQWNWDE